VLRGLHATMALALIYSTFKSTAILTCYTAQHSTAQHSTAQGQRQQSRNVVVYKGLNTASIIQMKNG
jgi:hypothetical protein